MASNEIGLLKFREMYFDRIWGGDGLRRLFGKPIPSSHVGEAWLISDRPECESVVIEGPCAGETLRSLIERNAFSVLGTRPRLTPSGRFPLLLKLLDAVDVLSVQVHPDDKLAEELGENDIGKTEMWHILHAEPGSDLICGLDPGIDLRAFGESIKSGSVERHMARCSVKPGDSVFLSAGVLHALGKGIVLAEIQQNSDLTYRVYDWGRVDTNGRPRELHVDRALKAIRFGRKHPGPHPPLVYEYESGHQAAFLAACRFFAAERIDLRGEYTRDTRHESFHILMGLEGGLQIEAAREIARMAAGEAVMVPGSIDHYQVCGNGAFVDYYVPDLDRDVRQVLVEKGIASSDIAVLGLEA